ncbi:MAG TPA: ERAP1-like C-terminal domain-containing protein, partial [Thermoanaerobaculia bacterium]|nr:ERAP1-like C-terminal domain-containing protein [Thermoanaerobaculia bacterium]
LVTMQWWNDIWLNEGFATFMSGKPIEAWKPEWHLELDKPVQTDTALTVDSQLSTRPIRAKEMEAGGGAFDAAITYDKTSSVLRMVEEWIGPDNFRDAIRTYLKKYSWGNAAAEDFWAVMKASSKQPTDAVLESFIDFTGAPLLHVMESCDANQRQITIAQTRMLPNGATAPSQTWTVPVCVSGGSCALLTQPSETLGAMFDCLHPTFLSRNGAGYFLVDYPTAERVDLRSHLADLNAAERIWYEGNEWLLARFNLRDAGEYLALVRAMPRTSAPRPLVGAIAEHLVYLDQRLVTGANRAQWQKLVRDALRGYAPFTFETPAGETSEQRIARSYVLWALGYTGDPQTIAAARQTAEQYMKDPSSVDALIADRALRITAVYGDAPFFDRVVAQLEKAPTPELGNRYRGLLSLFRDPQVEEKAIAYIYSDKVRLQDLPQSVSTMFVDPATRPAAWAAAKGRWSDLEKRSFGTVGRITGSLANFCDPESRTDVTSFFEQHPMRAGQRTLRRAVESIDTCIAFRAAQQKRFDEALK